MVRASVVRPQAGGVVVVVWVGVGVVQRVSEERAGPVLRVQEGQAAAARGARAVVVVVEEGGVDRRERVEGVDRRVVVRAAVVGRLAWVVVRAAGMPGRAWPPS